MDFKTKYSNCRHNFGRTRPVAGVLRFWGKNTLLGKDFYYYQMFKIVRWQRPTSVQCRPSNVLLLFLYLRSVLFKNLNDATLSSLGNRPNIQIKAAITGNLVFVNISVMHGIKIILVSVPTFGGVKNRIKPSKYRLHFIFC